MSEPKSTKITVERQKPDGDVTFIATKFPSETLLKVGGPLQMITDQIVVSPSDYSGDRKIDCGIYKQWESEYIGA